MTSPLPVIESSALAVIPVRDGVLPAGADEAAAEAGGAALLVGGETRSAAEALTAVRRVWLAESATVAPGALAGSLAPLLAGIHALVLPASPDGRDLAPRLADALGRPLLAGAVTVTEHGAEVARDGDRVLLTLSASGPFVATLLPGLRGAQPEPGDPEVIAIGLPAPRPVADARLVELLAADPDTAELNSAPRILGAGAGIADAQLSGVRALELLGEVGRSLGAAVGATRVVTEAGWTGHERQIGTTGVIIDPELYIAFGISGAAQHIGGIGHPRHVVSVNTDPSCPMTAMADLGIVADAPAVLTELVRRLGPRAPDADRAEGGGHD